MFGKWKIHRSADQEISVEVSEKDGIRSLHLGSQTVQSSMRLADPTELVLSYTRAMMAFLLFDPHPQRILMIGLGGGSLAKFAYRHLPSAHITVVESQPRVIAAARQYFHVPADDGRFCVQLAEGGQWVGAHPRSCEVMMVDGYDAHQQVPALTSEGFYADARAALTDGGLLVVNLWSSDSRFDTYVQRIERVFDAVACVPAERRGNVVALAFDRSPGRPRWDDLRLRARDLQSRYGLEFLKFVEGLRELNPHTDGRLTL
ncbi:MAG: polyamine aminopropyltransferase [Betaproteobacteria bacterium]